MESWKIVNLNGNLENSSIEIFNVLHEFCIAGEQAIILLWSQPF